MGAERADKEQTSISSRQGGSFETTLCRFVIICARLTTSAMPFAREYSFTCIECTGDPSHQSVPCGLCHTSVSQGAANLGLTFALTEDITAYVGLQIAVLTGLPRLLLGSRPCIVNRAAAVLAEQESAKLPRRVLYIITCRVASRAT